MSFSDWAYRPLAVGAPFPLGDSPFRARGVAFLAALRYVDRRLAGGRDALQAALANDAFGPYYQQLFVTSGDYDAAPLLRLFVFLAQQERVAVGKFIAERSRVTAELDAKGMYKILLDKPTPERVAERLPLAFSRYFVPCRAEAVSIRERRFECALSRLAEPMSGLYASSTAGFVGRCLELAGATLVRFRWTAPTPDGQLRGTPTVKTVFVAEW